MKYLRYGLLALLFLLPVGCFTGQISPTPEPQVQGVCVGDINKDGAVSIDEATIITVARAKGEVSGDVLIVTDVDGDGVINDTEFYQVIQNQASRRCQYVK